MEEDSGAREKIELRIAADLKDFEAICDLEKRNFVETLEPDFATKYGFTSVLHTPEELAAMSEHLDQIIAVNKKDGSIIGYLLTLPAKVRTRALNFYCSLDLVSSRRVKYGGIPLVGYKFVTTSVCVELAYRGQGICQKMYDFLRKRLHDEFQMAVAYIAPDNNRSIRAHQKVGFIVIGHTPAIFHDISWVVAVWDWKNQHHHRHRPQIN
jgi:RimJ/RimL family protein N-acetyltransferase